MVKAENVYEPPVSYEPDIFYSRDGFSIVWFSFVFVSLILSYYITYQQQQKYIQKNTKRETKQKQETTLPEQVIQNKSQKQTNSHCHLY
jgi:hypothetical protein